MAFQCSVATPEGLLYEGTLTSATVPAFDGQVGILTDRAPILLKLGAGPLHLHATSNSETVYFVAGGVAQMKDNVLTILADEAKPVDQLDVEAARKDLAELANAPQANEAQLKIRERKLNRARAVVALAGAH